MNEGWIKIYRKFSDWEWFNISEMVHLFIYLLINANHQDGEWRGIIVKRGQILTGLNSLNESTKISVQTLRTCLKRLEKTKEINIQSTNKYSIITICKYDDYQSEQQTTNKQTNKRLTNKQQTTNNKQECKEEQEEKEEKTNNIKFDFKQSVIDLGVEEQIILDWLIVRKNKKASNTETAFNKLKREIEKSKLPANECVKIAVERNWQGFEYEWIKNIKIDNVKQKPKLSA